MSDELGRQFLHDLSFGAYRCDSLGEVIASNQMSREITDGALVPGSNLFDVFPDDEFRVALRSISDHRNRVEASARLGTSDSGRIYRHVVTPRQSNGNHFLEAIFWARDPEQEDSDHKYAPLRTLATMIDHTPGVAVHVFDPEGCVHVWNPASEEIYGFAKEEILGVNMADMLDGDEAKRFREMLNRVASTAETVPPHKWEVERKDGSSRTVISTMFPFEVTEGSLLIGCMDVDVTREELLEASTEERDATLALLVNRLPIAIWSTNQDLEVTMIQGRGLYKIAEDPDLLIGAHLSEITNGHEMSSALIQAHESALNGHASTLEHEWDERWYVTHIQPLRKEEEIIGVVGIAQNITSQDAADNTGRQHSSLDPLTRLPNRAALHSRVEAAAAHARRHDHVLGLILIDIDDFKRVNKALGHKAGDQILREISKRLEQAFRAEDTVARIGGDTFAVLLPGVTGTEELLTVAQKIRDLIHQPFSSGSGGGQIRLTACAGTAAIPEECEKGVDLIRLAESALDHAKAAGHDTIRRCSEDATKSLWSRLAIETGLYAALDQDQLELHYQPVVDLGTGEPRRFESLLRWNHPSRGLIQAGEFIDLAERSALVLQLGEWVLREACRQIRRWSESGIELPVAVNVSARQLRDTMFAEEIERVLVEERILPERLEIEITETAAMTSLEHVIATVHRIRQLGCHVTLDDFGTGYSSLSHLIRFPLDSLKIDREFVEDVALEGLGKTIVTAILSTAKSLELRVVAEGVETAEQRKALRELGCRLGQGYLFAPPLSVREAEAFLSSRLKALP